MLTFRWCDFTGAVIRWQIGQKGSVLRGNKRAWGPRSDCCEVFVTPCQCEGLHEETRHVDTWGM